MATHSSILAWKISWTEEPGGLQSMGSQSRARLSDSHLLTYLPYKPKIPFLGEMKMCVHTEYLYVDVQSSTIFNSKKYKQSKCPSAHV